MTDCTGTNVTRLLAVLNGQAIGQPIAVDYCPVFVHVTHQLPIVLIPSSSPREERRPCKMGDAISSLLFQPPSPTYLHPSRHFWLTTAQGNGIPAFFIERPNATVTILFSHGNAEDLGMIYDWFNDLARVLRVNIMAYDYTGYGKPNGTGTPSEENCYADIEAAYRYLVEVRRIRPEQIILYGRSLGSGPSCYLAKKTAQEGRSVGGVILQSPLLSAYRVAFNFRFTMVGDRFPNIDYAPNIKCPVFIIHGTQDEVVPFWHGQELFLALPQQWRAKPFWVEGAGHNNIEALLRSEGTFVRKLVEFLDLHVAARSGKIEAPKTVPECLPVALREIETGHVY
jgi:abhydrolase domain-containing protein 17